MLKKSDAYLLLLNTIRKNKKHADYERVCELAKKYKAMISGEGLDEYLEQFNLREDEVLFDQRKRLTSLITSCIVGTLITPEKKVPAIKPITKSFDYKKANKQRKQELDQKAEGFYGGQGIDNYLTDAFMNLWDSDPNAFELFLFDDFNSRIQKPTVYATEISCEDAIDFEYVNNVLNYLTILKTIQFLVVSTENDLKPKYKDGKYYTIFGDNDQIEFTQVDVELIKGVIPENELFSFDQGTGAVTIIEAESSVPKADYYFRMTKTVLYKVNFYETKSKRVPAFRVGSIPDIETDRRTCINGWHRALPYLMKSISAVSELDISRALHVFPQKFEYRPRCMGTIKNKQTFACDYGRLPDGSICESCQGTGFQSHSSAQDVIYMGLPRKKEDAFDLSELIHYAVLPIDIVKWMDDYIDKIELKAIRAVFNSDVFIKTSLVQTATEKMIDMQSVYDALNPLFQRYSYGWVFTVQQLANYSDIDADLVIKHIFPKNSKFESVDNLIARLKGARDAGVNDYSLAYMDSEISSLIFVDQPDILQQIIVKQRFFPFVGKSETTIMALISNNLITRHDQVLYSEFSRIFSDLEAQVASKEIPKDGESTSFYQLTHEAQKLLIDAKVEEIIAKLDEENPPVIDNASPFFAGNGSPAGAN